ncbi:ferritin-like domain-containing protein [Pontibacter actiniarum]|uniref:Dessication-associated protein n=1 Tax=Pontibacter actiniarum TaxID=323450 RepID=A0A1X9YXI6_9BACT|nr:ferritin-like domain-containing protein [Pontibacter actiniarum]ARS37491.1 dessication-associated protein [Pontibacter actiniarum]
MNIFKIIKDIEKVDPEVYDRLASRRAAMSGFGSFGKKVALAAVPLAMGSMFKKAYGQSTNSIVDILNYALTLEYLEYNFYEQALAATALNLGDNREFFMEVRDNELAHVNFLKSAITSLGGTPIDAPTFDFSAGGAFPTWNSDAQVFLTLSQAFEDTGVRAYKGQAANLAGNPAILTAALQIHSVEARHAAIVRRIRGLKGWITGGPEGEMVPAPAEPVYQGEDQTVQAGVNVPQVSNVAPEQVTEAFDEPLSMAIVNDIAELFIVK